MKLGFVVTKFFVKFADAKKKRTPEILLIDQCEKSLTIAHSKIQIPMQSRISSM